MRPSSLLSMPCSAPGRNTTTSPADTEGREGGAGAQAGLAQRGGFSGKAQVHRCCPLQLPALPTTEAGRQLCSRPPHATPLKTP